MKEYTTLEALKKLSENPELVFCIVRDGKRSRIGYPKDCSGISWISEDGTYESDIELNEIFLNQKWTIAKQPVSFMEAINSGKRIKAEGQEDYQPVSKALWILSNSFISVKLINGKWYIKEE